MEVPKPTLKDHHNRKKTAIKINGGGGGGGGAAIGAVLLLGGALATAAFFGNRCWNSGKDHRRRLQDQKNCKQDGSFGATEDSNVPEELSGGTQDVEPDNVAAVVESIQLGENPRVEETLRPAVVGNDVGSAATDEDETLNMMNGGEVKIPLIKEDNVSDEVEIKETNNFVLVYDADVRMKCEHGVKVTGQGALALILTPQTEARQIEEKRLGVLYIESGEKCGKIEDHGSEEDNVDEKEHATEGGGRVENELDKDEEIFGQDGDDVGPKDELVAVAEGNTPCEEDIAIQMAAKSTVVVPLLNGGRHLPTSNEISFDNKEAEEDLILPENDEDEIEEEEPVQIGKVTENNVVDQLEEDLILPKNEFEEEEPDHVVEVKENNVVGQLEEELILPENEIEEEELVQVAELKENNVVEQLEEYLILPENEIEEEEPAQVADVKENNVVGQPKQHKDNVERITVDEVEKVESPITDDDNVERITVDEVEKVESPITDDMAMRMYGNTDHLSEIIEESSVETSDSCIYTQQHLAVVVEETLVETSDFAIDDSYHSSKIVVEDSSTEADDSPIDTKSETIPPPEPLHMPCQEQMVIQEVEGKTLEDSAVKPKAHDLGGEGEDIHTIAYSGQFSGLPEKRLMKKYAAELVRLKTSPMRRAVALGTVWVWCSWFFGLSLVKLCAIVALTVALSKLLAY